MAGRQEKTVAVGPGEILGVIAELVEIEGGEKIGNPEPLADIALALAARHDEHVPPEIGGATPERGEIGSSCGKIVERHLSPCPARRSD